jgi:hypothetical protein
MSKGGNKVSLQNLLVRDTLAAVSTTFAAKYNMEEPLREQTPDVDAVGQVKATYEQIEQTIVPILKNNENIRARFNLMISMLGQVQSHIPLKAFEELELQTDMLVELAKADLQGFENVKSALLKSPDLSSDLTQRMTQLIDKLVDYENTICGIAINKREQLEEAIAQVDVEDFRKNLYGTVLTFFFALVSIVVREFDEEKLSKVLGLGITCSEQVESYIETIDTLSDRQRLESIRQSEKHYNLT